mgnify:CR=1 FL=1
MIRYQKNMPLLKNKRETISGTTKHSLPLDGGGLGRGWQRQTGRELPDHNAAVTVFTLPLTPSRQGRGGSDIETGG